VPDTFNPDRIAALETAGWKAYAARNWPRFLLTITVINAEEFRIPFPLSLVASWYITRAGVAWAPADHDEGVVGALMEQYYSLASRYSAFSFDPMKVAQYELWYWDVHRRRTLAQDRTEFTDALTALHAEIFGIQPEQARRSAEMRVEANYLYDRILLHQAPNTVENWAAVQSALQAAYRSAAAAMSGGSV
jgi:hypothetical protein